MDHQPAKNQGVAWALEFIRCRYNLISVVWNYFATK
jgi:hypothetical protein